MKYVSSLSATNGKWDFCLNASPARYGNARCGRPVTRTLKDCPTQGQIMKKTTLIAALACSLAAMAPLAVIATPAPDPAARTSRS